MNHNRARLLELVKQRALIFRDITLASGQKSTFYIDGKMILMSSESSTLLGDVLYEMTKDLQLDAIGGPEIGALPLATATVIRYHQAGRKLEGFSVRKEVKTHGTQKQIEGKLEAGNRVAIVEDVMTTGGSVVQAIEAVQKAGAKIELVICIVDRLQGARERIEGMALRFASMFTINDLGMIS
jgi:orotate phosphoribosyltransferase